MGFALSPVNVTLCSLEHPLLQQGHFSVCSFTSAPKDRAAAGKVVDPHVQNEDAGISA